MESDRTRVHANDERTPVTTVGDGVQVIWEVVYDFGETTRGSHPFKAPDIPAT